jgi:hypothetical protein
MPLVITKPVNVLPFLRIKQSKKTRQRSAVWHVGPWQYDTATGRHKVKLGRKLRWESRTRAQRAAAKKTREARRAAERAAWDRFFATKDSAAPAPAPTRTVRTSANRGATAAKSSYGRRRTAPTRPADASATPGGTPCLLCGTAPAASGDLCPSCKARTRKHDRRTGPVDVDAAGSPAGMCGAVTRDGGRCQRTGDCPYHSTTNSKANRTAARDTGTGKETR